MGKCGESAERGLRLGAMGRDTYRRLEGGVYRGLSLVVLAGCLGGMGTSAALERVVHRIPSVVGRPARAGEGTGRFCPLRFSKPRIYHVAGGVANIAVADLGNGDSDIVLTDFTGGSAGDAVQVFYGAGNGRIGWMRSYRVRGGPYALAVADLGNGHPDVVVTQPSKNTVSVLYGVGGGRIGKIRSYRVGRYPQGLTVADLGNGHPDIVVANSGGHTVSVLYGVGGGRIGPIRSYRVGEGPFFLAAADLGNGHPDIVVVNTHTVSVLYGAGGGRIGSIRSYRVGKKPVGLAVADLGNGHPDIVVGSDASGHSVTVLYGVGGGRIGPIRVYRVAGGGEYSSRGSRERSSGHRDSKYPHGERALRGGRGTLCSTRGLSGSRRQVGGKRDGSGSRERASGYCYGIGNSEGIFEGRGRGRYSLRDWRRAFRSTRALSCGDGREAPQGRDVPHGGRGSRERVSGYYRGATLPGNDEYFVWGGRESGVYGSPAARGAQGVWSCRIYYHVEWHSWSTALIG